MDGVYTYFVLALTAASTFMAADTASRVLAAPADRAASLLLCAWTATLVLTLLGYDCVTLLASLHAIVFVVCAAVTYVRDSSGACARKDYIHYPLVAYMPLFVTAYTLHVCFSAP